MAETGSQKACRAPDDGIEHVVLLMMENHSFDQMLGALQQIRSDLDGVTPALAATRHNLARDGTQIFQQETRERQMSFDPRHEHVNVAAQLDGGNGGFVREFQNAYPKCSRDDLNAVMGYYPLDFLPALHALARDFTICDNWFSSLPGPTWPNRFFALSGTCCGELLMPSGKQLLDPKWYVEQKQTTLFDRLTEKQIDWRIYYYDFPCSLVLKNQREAKNLAAYSKINAFFAQAVGAAAAFPKFALIEPQYFGEAENDDHPPHNVMKAEKLIADVYNALRANRDLWESTLLVVVYDEHGGFYDHVTPPAAVAPDRCTSAYPFDQLGVRVPALLVSPRCGRRVEKTQFDHTSLLKYLTRKWGLGPLGERTAAAHGIGCAIVPGAPVRTDTIAFIRVPNADLISGNVELERNAGNANRDGLHHLAEFLLAGLDAKCAAPLDAALAEAVQLGADVATVGNRWIALKHSLGRSLTAAGAWLSRDMRLAQHRRDQRLGAAVDALKRAKGVGAAAGEK